LVAIIRHQVVQVFQDKDLMALVDNFLAAAHLSGVEAAAAQAVLQVALLAELEQIRILPGQAQLVLVLVVIMQVVVAEVVGHQLTQQVVLVVVEEAETKIAG
jgi:hypothetical protein